MQDDWKHCYRLRASLRNLGIVGAALMFGMTLFSVAAWFRQPANNPVKMPFVVSGCLLFTALYIYFILLYCRYRLYVGDASIRQTGILSDQHVDLTRIRELRWRCFPNTGSILLRDSHGKLKIELGNLEKEERLQLIDLLRLSIAESKQLGWRKFNDRFADTPDRKRKAIRGRVLFGMIFGLHAVAFSVIWAIGGGNQFLVYSVVNAVMVVYLLNFCRQKMDALGPNAGEPCVERERAITRFLKS